MAYVELEKARELLFELRNDCIASNVKEDTTRGILYSINELEKLPTADVAEVKRGYWIGQYPKVPKCSVCGAIDSMKGNYCRYCGAKMDGRSEV